MRAGTSSSRRTQIGTKIPTTAFCMPRRYVELTIRDFHPARGRDDDRFMASLLDLVFKPGAAQAAVRCAICGCRGRRSGCLWVSRWLALWTLAHVVLCKSPLLLDTGNYVMALPTRQVTR